MRTLKRGRRQLLPTPTARTCRGDVHSLVFHSGGRAHSRSCTSPASATSSTGTGHDPRFRFFLRPLVPCCYSWRVHRAAHHCATRLSIEVRCLRGSSLSV